MLTDNLNGIESYTIGMWLAKDNVYVPMVIPEKDYFIKLGVEEDFYKSFEPEIIKCFQDTDTAEFYKIIGDEFSKKVKSTNHYEYGITALISEWLMNLYNGVLYPEIKT